MEITPLDDPYCLLQDGSRPLTADWDAGDFKITANTFDLTDEDTGYQIDGESILFASNDSTILGHYSGTSLTTGTDSVFVGRYAGYNQTTNSNLFIVDNQDRGAAGAELTNSLIYAVFNSAVLSQTMRINVGTLTTGDIVCSDLTGDTITSEQLTSTDDITMQGHLLTLGNGTANDIVLSFSGLNNSTTITYDESDDKFNFTATTYDLGAGDIAECGRITFENKEYISNEVDGAIDVYADKFRIYDNGGGYVNFVIGGVTCFRYEDADSGHFQMINGASKGLYVFEDATSGENPVVRIYGYPTGTSAATYGQFQVVDINGAVGWFSITGPASTGILLDSVTLITNKLAFTQEDLNEYIDSLNDGYMDYGATTGHRFNANVDITGTINTTSDDNWDLNDYTAGTVTDTGYVIVTINGTEYKLLARLEP